MSITSLRLDESVKLEFDVVITGADGLPSSRFVIEGKDFSVSFPCRSVNNGIEVDVGNLKNVLPAGDYPVRLEVVLENRIYTPMQDTIKLEPVVEINTRKKTVVDVKENVEVVGKVNVVKGTAPQTDSRGASAPLVSTEEANLLHAVNATASVLADPNISILPTVQELTNQIRARWKANEYEVQPINEEVVDAQPTPAQLAEMQAREERAAIEAKKKAITAATAGRLRKFMSDK